MFNLEKQKIEKQETAIKISNENKCKDFLGLRWFIRL